MIEPRPMPPYLPIYPESERAGIQQRYEQAEREWQRRVDFVMWTNAIPVICACAGLIAAALMGPQIVLDAIRVLALR